MSIHASRIVFGLPNPAVGYLCAGAVLLVTTQAIALEPRLCINEMMAANATTLPDADGDFSDWIELFNGAEASLSLGGFGLSDDESEPFKWIFPDVPLLPDSFLLVFASGKDLSAWPGELHTSFSLDAGGEEILLTAPDGLVVDFLPPVISDPDVSYGRAPDGGPDWYFFAEATPGSSNGDEPPMDRAPPPHISPPSGFYAPGTMVAMSCPAPLATIYYTLDGHTPTDTSIRYTVPIAMDTTTAVSAISIVPGLLESDPSTGNYIISYQTSLPVVSLVTDPENLWDEETGIYVEGTDADPEPPHYGANYWQDHEIPVHLEFFEADGSIGFTQNVGAKIHGGFPRCFPQKSLRITARDRYGSDRLRYRFFTDLPITAYKAVILRNSGNDWWFSMFRDAMMTSLLAGSSVAYQAYRPVVVFLNGQYWGIHNIREKLDEHYLSSHYGVDEGDVDIIENHQYPVAGDVAAYEELLSFVEGCDMANPATFDSLHAMMDLHNFALYQAAEIYFANLDWPANNSRCWRHRQEDGKWQWLLYDTDFGFGLIGPYDHNTLNYATTTHPHGGQSQNPTYATFLLRRLLENVDFRELFIVHFCDLLNNAFSTEFVLDRIEEIKGGIESEMPLHEARWYPYHDWGYELGILRTFAELRPSYVVQHLRGKFDLGEMARLTLEVVDDAGGRLWVNSFPVDNLPWSGDYFEGLPVQLLAEPFDGYRFVGWEGDIAAASASLRITLEWDTHVYARFEPVDDVQRSIVVTEINYHSADDFDPGDWIELYAIEACDLTGWILRDTEDSHGFVFPQYTSLMEGEFLVLASDRLAFQNLFPAVSPVLGDIGFNLSNSGDQIRVFDYLETLIDSVAYDDEPPWPPQADGSGPALQLINPVYANELPHNWSASLTPHGDPGSASWSGMALRVSRNGLEFTLSWTPWRPAHEYWVYGGDHAAHLKPVVPDPLLHRIATLPSWEHRWPLRDGASDPNRNWTYLVIAVDEFGNRMSMSNRIGIYHLMLHVP